MGTNMQMKNRIALLLMIALLAACGADSTAPETTAALEPSTTTMAVTTTEPPTTTTSTTTVAASEAALGSLMASLETGDEVTAARIEGSIEMTGLDSAAGGVSEVVILFSSSFDNLTGDSAFLIDMSSMTEAMETDPDDPFAGLAAGFLGTMEFRQIGERVFTNFYLFTAMFGAETDWVSMPAEESDQFANGFDTMPTDPDEILETYEDASADIEDLGMEEVNGATATHYRLSLDTEHMDLSDAERAELEASGLFAGGIVPMDLWISEDGHLVRMVITIDGSGIDAPAEEQFETMTIRYDILDINGDITIEEPPASEVTAIEDLEDFLGTRDG